MDSISAHQRPSSSCPSTMEIDSGKGVSIDCALPSDIIVCAAPPTANDSCLMQDEPETGPGFSYKMSLKASSEMLGVDHQHGRFECRQPGADSGVSGRKCAGPVSRARTRRNVRLDGEDPGAARVRQ